VALAGGGWLVVQRGEKMDLLTSTGSGLSMKRIWCRILVGGYYGIPETIPDPMIDHNNHACF